MNIQTDVNLENPDTQAAVMQQLQATLAKQGVTDFKLTWTKQPVQISRKKIDDACLNVWDRLPEDCATTNLKDYFKLFTL